MRPGLHIAALLAFASLVANEAEAQPPPTPPSAGYAYPGRRFGFWDYFGTAWTLGTFYGIEAGLAGASTKRFAGPIPPFDDLARSAFRAPTRRGREAADRVSDYLWYSSVSYPVLTSLATPLARGADFDMVWQLTMMNIQAFAAISVVVRLPHKLVGRARPNDLGCQEDPEYSEQCAHPSARLASFPGGHVGVSMTGAGLSCAHHMHADLYGGGALDWVACSSAVIAANAVGFLRLRADKHWITDHIIGAAAGFGIGYGFPTLLYYHPFWREDEEEAASSGRSRDTVYWTVTPQIDERRLGMAVIGLF